MFRGAPPLGRKEIILKIAKEKYPEIRKRKYNLNYYLENFIHVLNDLVKWQSLKLINTKSKEYHWKTIYNEFNKWSNNIFKDAFYLFIKTNYFKISKVKKDKKINLLIDVTKITNTLGSELIAVNCEYKKKNVTALTVICDQNKLPLKELASFRGVHLV